ncbi:MAG: hypothetical protein JJU34_09065 [Lunatimonas sp.]|uniref:hypothetical protein n=1 Tax=Lunatimonas sp. TaxID=2060141 RepID=UPI00263B59EC|nr:hypothetical protein [Lunatimonas sp.]MCC5937419.1 hypothetical protein [Lunatimonas sp.]
MSTNRLIIIGTLFGLMISCDSNNPDLLKANANGHEEGVERMELVLQLGVGDVILPMEGM